MPEFCLIFILTNHILISKLLSASFFSWGFAPMQIVLLPGFISSAKFAFLRSWFLLHFFLIKSGVKIKDVERQFLRYQNLGSGSIRVRAKPQLKRDARSRQIILYWFIRITVNPLSWRYPFYWYYWSTPVPLWSENPHIWSRNEVYEY